MSKKNNFEKISKLLLEEVEDRFDKEPMSVEGLEFGQSFAELLDRFFVLHIRMWKMEDACGETEDAEEIKAIKKKIDLCFKVHRPKMTRAINFFLDSHIDKNKTRPFSEESVKFYRGYDG